MQVCLWWTAEDVVRWWVPVRSRSNIYVWYFFRLDLVRYKWQVCKNNVPERISQKLWTRGRKALCSLPQGNTKFKPHIINKLTLGTICNLAKVEEKEAKRARASFSSSSKAFSHHRSSINFHNLCMTPDSNMRCGLSKSRTGMRVEAVRACCLAPQAGTLIEVQCAGGLCCPDKEEKGL